MAGVSAEPGWTVTLHRGTPGIGDVADYARARGATVIWCGPECCGGDDEEDTMSVFDDPGLDQSSGPVPAEEHRGGEHPDWANARPGKPLREMPDPGPGPDGEG